MNQRERLLAIIVGCLGLVLALWFGWSYVDGQFRKRRERVQGLEREIANFKRQTMQSQVAARKLGEYESRSLPPNAEEARTLYQDWLFTRISEAGFSEQQVRALTSKEERDLYVEHNFVITGKATLRQTVDFLHAIYSADYLHRITSLVLKPLKDNRQLEVTINIDAVSMLTAPQAPALHQQKSQRLALPTKEKYYEVILGRNLFGPQNQLPKVSLSGSKDLTINRPAGVSVKATDPDPDDKVSYKALELPAPEAKFNEKTGQLDWVPNKLGKYKLVVEVQDNGYPRSPVKQEFALSVVEPRDNGPPPRPGFDQSKFTVLSGVIEVDGQRQIWLHNRTQRDGLLKLHVGDAFEVGAIKGTVESIGLTDFTFVAEDGKVRRLAKGGNLNEAAEAPRSTELDQTLPPQ